MPEPPPRIYVASLSDYNAGILHGQWLDAAVQVDDLHTAVQAMLATSPTGHAEEWAIHDYEGFWSVHISEYESLERVSALARGIAEHREAFAVWADLHPDEVLEGFEDAYIGRWDSIESYAENLLEELGIDPDELGPENLRPYIHFDLAGFARDLASETGVVEGREGVYVFED